MLKKLSFGAMCSVAAMTVCQSVNAVEPAGWDYGLTKRCVMSPEPNGHGRFSENFYEDVAECEGPNHWTIAVQSEVELGKPCAALNNQTLAINKSDSPIKLSWHRNSASGNWSANMKTDIWDVAHPCGEGQFTNYVFKEQVGHGGAEPLAKVRGAIFQVVGNYSDWIPDPAGASRAFIGLEAWWIPEGQVEGKKFAIEINTQSNWGDSLPGAAMNTHGDNFLAIDGEKPEINVYFKKNIDTEIYVDVEKIFQWAVDNGYFAAPASGDWSQVNLVSTFIGTETYNAQRQHSVVANLWFTDWRLDQY